MFRNVATKIGLFAFDTTTGAPKTGDAANLTAYVSKDYGSVTVLTDTSATEMDATNAMGWYLFDVTQAETNGNALLFTAKSSTANITVVGQHIFTTPANFTSFVTPTGASVGEVTGAVGSVLGGIDTASGTVKTLDAAITALGTPTVVADAILNRDMATGTDSGGRTVRNALRVLRNKTAASAGTLTVTKEDDSTPAWTAALTTDAGAVPIVTIDPA